MTAAEPTPAHHVHVETTTFEDQPNARHTCTVCGAESVGEAPPLPCLGSERSGLSPRVDAAAGAAREARYAEAMYGPKPPVAMSAEEVIRAVMAVADEERAADRAEIERLRGLCIPITDLVQELDLVRQNLLHARAMSDAHFTRAEDTKARLDALVADLRWLADSKGSGFPYVQTRELRAVLDKHAGEQP